MKTDRILKLIQQKNVMRSGGALPLPKAQTGTTYVNTPCGPDYIQSTDQNGNPVCLPAPKESYTWDNSERFARAANEPATPGPAAGSGMSMEELMASYVAPNYGPNLESNDYDICPECTERQRRKLGLPSFKLPNINFPNINFPTVNFPNIRFPKLKGKRRNCGKGIPCPEWQDGGLIKQKKVMASGGSLDNMTVSEVWKQVTGSNWSQAKKLGLTDGSYQQNIALKAKLIENAKRKPAPAQKPKIGAAAKPVTPKPAAQKPKYQVQMPGVQRDATATRPSDQQRAYEFYSQQPFGVTNPNSRIPQNVQAAMMQAATQPDAVYETPTGVRSSLQSAYNQVARGTENDLANIVAGAVAYPLQGGLNITNAITGDVPIRSDADVLGLGLDAASLIPATKFVSNVRGVGRSLQRAGNGFLYPLSSNYRTGNMTQRFLADEARFPGLEVTRKGSRLAPKTITVKDVNNPDQYLKAIRHKDGSYHFQFDMSGVGPRRAGTAMQLLENQFKPLTQFKEVSTLSLDSYKNVLKRMSDSRYSVAPSGRTILNAQGIRNKFLDDLADPYFTNWDDYASGNLNANTAAAAQRWNEAGAPMYFSTKAAATEAAERLNSKYFGKTATGDELAMPIKGDNRKWTISLPNYKLTKLKKLGGTSRIRIKKRK